MPAAGTAHPDSDGTGDHTNEGVTDGDNGGVDPAAVAERSNTPGRGDETTFRIEGEPSVTATSVLEATGVAEARGVRASAPAMCWPDGKRILRTLTTTLGEASR
mmetsp:Transcript_41772/g.120676  ORF Transcript_41772/g.120676 Transcript_41772/m.120676 type:complete len:104 (-) Transcript_41772:148-459(-)